MIKTKKVLVFFVLALFLFSLSACEGAVGPEGPEGPQGPAGPAGEDGVDGEQGPAGPAGEDGEQGPAGPTGPEGPTGPVGPEGPAGQDGADGVDGLTPYVGENGNWFIGEVDTEIPATGPTGPDGVSPHIGENGNWFIGEVDTEIRAQGYSAYEIYVANYPGYEGTEAEWIQALATDALVLTLTVEYTNGITDEWPIFLNGQALPDSSVGGYEVNWYLDAGFTNLADGTYITEDMTVYVNVASDDLPEPTLDDVFPLTDEEYVVDEYLRFVSGETIFTVSNNAFLYDAEGNFLAFGIADIAGVLNPAANQVLAEITVVDGEVVELRFASASTDVEVVNDDVVANLDTTGAAIEIVYGTTVLELIQALAPVDGRDQVYTVLDDEAAAVTAGTTVVDHGFAFHVLAEDEVSELVYTISFVGNPSDASVAPVDDQTGIEALDIPNLELSVLPGTTQAEVLASLEGANPDYAVEILVVNSELKAKTNNAMATGDKVLNISVDGVTTVTWVVKVEASIDTAIEFDGELVAGGSIPVPWNFVADDVLALVSSANGYVQSYELQVYDADEDEFVEYVNDGTLIQEDATFQLVVTPEDEDASTATYGFTVLDSDDPTLAVIEGEENEVTDLDNTNFEINVRNGYSTTQLGTTLVAADGSVIDSWTVRNSAGGPRSGELFTGDVLTVVPDNGDTDEAIEYTIFVNDELSNTSLALVDSPVVIDSVSFARVISVSPFLPVTDPSNTALTATQFGHVLSDLVAFGEEFQTYTTGYYDANNENAWVETATVPSGLTIEDMIVKVTAQDETTTADYTIALASASSTTNITLVADHDDELISAFSNFSNTIDVFYEKTDGTSYGVNDDITLVLGQFDFASAQQRFVVGSLDTNGDWQAVEPTNFDDIVVRVYAESSVSGGAPYKDFAINYVKENTTSLVLVDDPMVIDSVSTFSSIINVFPEYVDGAYVPANVGAIVADINQFANFQVINEQLYLFDGTNYVATSSALMDLVNADPAQVPYILVTAQDGTTKYYQISVRAEISTTTLDQSDAEGAVEFTVSGSNLMVVEGTTEADLLAAIVEETYFQELAITANDGSSVGAELANYDKLTVLAQDGTEKVYTIMLTDAPEAPVVLSDVTTVDADDDDATVLYTLGTGVINVDADTEVADLIAALEANNADMTFEVLTSEGLAKSADVLYSWDQVVVTAEDGETTETYIIEIN